MTILVQYLKNPPRIEITQSDAEDLEIVGKILITNIRTARLVLTNLFEAKEKFEVADKL